MTSMKRLLVGLLTGAALGAGASPAWAVAEQARDEHACAYQQQSPGCQPEGFLPPRDGLIGNHNETLVRDEV